MAIGGMAKLKLKKSKILFKIGRNIDCMNWVISQKIHLKTY